MITVDVLNFGSLNIDHVYQVPHFVQPKETLSCSGYRQFAGGKGLNQSVALARAGVRVAHAGKIGADGEFLAETLRKAGVDTSLLLRGTVPTGHACIQVDTTGQNSILLFPGANRAITESEIDAILDRLEPTTILLLQNEINSVGELIVKAKKRHLTVAINPAPCGPETAGYPLELVDYLFVNEVEGAQLSGLDIASPPEAILDELIHRYPKSEIIMTLGGDGACYAAGQQRFHVAPVPVEVVDTTSAGDAFTGYFLAAKLRGCSACEAMQFATRAGGITVSRAGAAVSIPSAAEVFGDVQ